MADLGIFKAKPAEQIFPASFVVDVKNGHYRMQAEDGSVSDAIYFVNLSGETLAEVEDIVVKGLGHCGYNNATVSKLDTYWKERYIELGEPGREDEE